MLRRQEWVVPGQHPHSPALVLTPQQRRRRAAYFKPVPTGSSVLQPRRIAAVSATETESWISRELQAILLEHDVHLVTQVVMGTMATLSKACQGTGTRYLHPCRVPNIPFLPGYLTPDFVSQRQRLLCARRSVAGPVSKRPKYSQMSNAQKQVC